MNATAELCARIIANDPSLTDLHVSPDLLENVNLNMFCTALSANTVVTAFSWNASRELTCGMAVAALLRVNSTLTWLNLNYNRLLSDGIIPIAQALQANAALIRLDLFNTGCGDKEARALANMLERNDWLKYLRLGRNNIGDPGVSAMAGALQANSSLEVLSLYENKCSDVGVHALAKMILLNRRLLSLELWDNLISEVGQKQLVTALKANTVLVTMPLRYVAEECCDLIVRNRRLANARKLHCQDVLIAFLGVRKLHRSGAGLWANQPREMLKIVAMMVWNLKDQTEWVEKSKKRK